ncbi:putative multifunctional beta-oxidation protein [Calocera cornea HHB12733]|uniref:Putative multifunctional beta-oxidation protein n=1 Tax=Calocera cornea HHB12733 TaxID=1353952 RepID=A0A165HCX0_9BASI|nr:putative multifunctional beta-oxidation protein [Calocera cornea HHB12733]
MGLVAFTKTLAIEGAKYNIRASCIAPMAASAMTETIMPPEMLKHLNPSFIAPLIAVLTHPEGPNASGKVFEAGAGWMGEIRWERSKGAVFKTDDTFTPSAVKERWHEVTSFDKAEYPNTMGDADMMGVLELSKTLAPNKQSNPSVRFDGKVTIVTGAGGGLGRAYALMFGKLGGQVVVNDVNEQAAQKVVDEIKSAGGKAIAVACSVEEGQKIAQTAMDAFGRIDVLIANAGILRDKSFTAMTQRDWDDVIKVHLKGTYACAKAVWPIFQKQRYGRIVTTASQVGIYGNFGQANYSAAKAAILGLTRTLAIEGARYNIICNTLAPSAGTAMTSTVWPAEMVQMFKPDFIAPVVGYLVSEDNTSTSGCLFEVFGGCATQTRWQRAGGHGFPSNKTLTPEDVLSQWKVITNFDDGRSTHPTSTQEAIQQIVDNFNNTADSSSAASGDDADPESVKEAKKGTTEPHKYVYTERDVILYNLGIGATAEELKWTYEGDDDFQALPTFGVIPGFPSGAGMSLDWLPNFNPAKLLHGEQYLSIKAPIPTSGTLISTTRLLEALDKGKQAAITTVTETKDANSGKVIFETQSTAIIRGSGGFGGQKQGKDRGAATAANTPPKRQPDAVIEEETSPDQAALYRLSGDYNPLHIQPEFAAIGGFDRPILHGLCFFGIAGKHVLKSFGAYKDIKGRFAGSVYPGETLITEMWKEGGKVVFQMKVKERGTTVLSAAGATLVGDENLKAKL